MITFLFDPKLIGEEDEGDDDDDDEDEDDDDPRDPPKFIWAKKKNFKVKKRWEDPIYVHNINFYVYYL